MTNSGHLNRMLTACLLVSVILISIRSVQGQEKDFHAYPEHVASYLKRIYSQDRQPLAFREEFPGGFDAWQREARSELIRKIGLERIAASVGDHQPVVELDEPEDLGDYLRQRGVVETEPDVRIPFWLLKPKGDGPWPLGVFPHGHSRIGHDTSAGVYHDEAHKKRTLDEDRDVAVQAVKRGFLAIAPAVRGISTDGVPDLHGRHGNRDCRSHVMHCLAAGRTATGERVWDMQRILDWAEGLEEVDSRTVLMTITAVTGAASTLARLPSITQSASFALASADLTHTIRAGCILAEVGAIFIRSQMACSCSSDTGLPSQPL
jgi:hypothetical protein